LSDSLLDMATAAEQDLRWSAGASVEQRLAGRARAFEFYQAVRLLSMIADGDGEPRSDDVLVRFRSKMGFEFPGADIDRIELPDGVSDLPEITVNFMGLGGVHGPVPAAYTPQLLAGRDSALRDFLDIFNHRLIGMAYRIHALHHPELTRQTPSQGLVANLLFAVFGMDRDPESPVRNKLEIPDRALLDYGGLLAHGPHSANGLERLIQDYFEIPATVSQFTGAWLSLSPDQWTRLGIDNQIVGESAILGRRVWDEHAGVTIHLGPLDLPTFKSFLPEGDAYPKFRDLVRFYLRDEFEVTLNLVLRSDQTPRASTTSSAQEESRAHPAILGRLAWLRPAHETTSNGHGAGKTNDLRKKVRGEV
jgi:type VI secretion system protein ImpH